MNACQTLIRLLVALLVMASSSGCSTLNPPKPGDSPEYRPVAPLVPIPSASNHGGIYQAAQSQGLFEDYKARRVGDLVTVQLVEKTNAKKSAVTSTAKNSTQSIDLAVPTVAGVNELTGLSALSPSLLAAKNNTDRTFDGSGDSSQSNQLSGEITVTVAEVLSNGNLVVQGEKWLGINQGNEFVRLRGIIRPVDISATNSVTSSQIANAELSYGGTGAIQDSNAQGWLARFFNSPIWPL